MSKQVMAMGDRMDKWLKDALPPTEEDSARQAVQLAILKERLRTRKMEQRRRRTRCGVAAVPLVVLVLFFGDVVDLGGDSFELVEVENTAYPELDLKIVRNEFRGGVVGTSSDATDEEVQELTQQIAAGEGTIIRVEGWRVGGVTRWSLQMRHDILGKIEVTSRTPYNPPSGRSRALGEFLMTEWESIEADINSGSIEPAGGLNMEFDGIPFVLEYWVVPSERFGEVTCYSGVPIR